MNNTPTPRTDQRTYSADCLGKTAVCNADWAKLLEQELTEQCELLGKGSEREALLIGKVSRLERENAKLQAHADRVNEANDRLTMELSALRAERDALHEEKARLDWLEESQMLWEGKDWLRGPEFITRAAIDAARKGGK